MTYVAQAAQDAWYREPAPSSRFEQSFADYVGAQPVFADIDPTTWCISPESIDRLITVKTRAVIRLDGLPADVPAIRAIAEKFKLHVI